ncbi:MAG TPA: hypothetical protein VKB93_20035 [Thermoanaerobaculia bacterium]|nr:hypothetical protein [Thermoanaerobaculia bacterium]
MVHCNHATYSQEAVLAAGGLPTWNSPDILTNYNTPWSLLAEPSLKVRNL